MAGPHCNGRAARRAGQSGLAGADRAHAAGEGLTRCRVSAPGAGRWRFDVGATSASGFGEPSTVSSDRTRAVRPRVEKELTMTITITAWERSPDGGKGLARDTRVRWALEEAGQPYDVRLVSFRGVKEPAHLALHPFGQIPTYEDGALALFESGAIVFHIAERHGGLLP